MGVKAFLRFDLRLTTDLDRVPGAAERRRVAQVQVVQIAHQQPAGNRA